MTSVIGLSFSLSSANLDITVIMVQGDVNDNECYQRREGGNRFRECPGNYHLLERQQINTLGNYSRNSFVGIYVIYYAIKFH